MFTHVDHLLHSILQQGLPLALSFLDDVLVLFLAKIGIPLPGLHWLSWVLLVFTIVYYIVHFLRYHFKSVDSKMDS
jgi:hypothetical protein